MTSPWVLAKYDGEGVKRIENCFQPYLRAYEIPIGRSARQLSRMKSQEEKGVWRGGRENGFRGKDSVLKAQSCGSLHKNMQPTFHASRNQHPAEAPSRK